VQSTSKATALLLAIQNGGFDVKNHIKNEIENIQVPKQDRIIPLKHSVQYSRATGHIPRFIPYSKDSKYPVFHGGVVFQIGLQIDYNENDFLSSIYDLLEEAIGETIIIRSIIDVYKEDSGQIVFLKDSLDNNIFLDYTADNQLTFIGLTNRNFNSYYSFELSSDGSYRGRYVGQK
jgi:hypothetical protein